MASEPERADRDRFEGLDPAARRRVFAGSVVRTCLVLVLIIGAYYLLPVGGFREGNPVGAWLRLAGVILVFLAGMVLQVREVVGADVPLVRAVEAVVESVVLFICLFALLYVSMSAADPALFSERLDRTGALYFAASTFATVGFGDIVATGSLARAVVTVQILADLGILVLIARTAFFAARHRHPR